MPPDRACLAVIGCTGCRAAPRRALHSTCSRSKLSLQFSAVQPLLSPARIVKFLQQSTYNCFTVSPSALQQHFRRTRQLSHSFKQALMSWKILNYHFYFYFCQLRSSKFAPQASRTFPTPWLIWGKNTNIHRWKAYYNALKMWVSEVGAGEGAGGTGDKLACAGAGASEITPAPTSHMHIFRAL